MDILSSGSSCALATWTEARFYRDVLGLAIYREFGAPDDPGVVFFLGPGQPAVRGDAVRAAWQAVW